MATCLCGNLAGSSVVRYLQQGAAKMLKAVGMPQQWWPVCSSVIRQMLSYMHALVH